MNEPQKALVAALRSGEYKQTTHTLCRINSNDVSYCCLGVACEIYQKIVGGLTITEDERQRSYNGRRQDLPVPVEEWLGFVDGIGKIDEAKHDKLQAYLDSKEIKIKAWNLDTLAELNDNAVPFDAIADIIENGFVEEHAG